MNDSQMEYDAVMFNTFRALTFFESYMSPMLKKTKLNMAY